MKMSNRKILKHVSMKQKLMRKNKIEKLKLKKRKIEIETEQEPELEPEPEPESECKREPENENESKNLSHLYVKTLDNGQVLPGYTKLLTRSIEEEISITDLDQLQHDLEKLLIVCAIRRRALSSDFQIFNKTEERPEKKHKLIEESASPSSPKIRKRIIEKKIKRKPGRPFKNRTPDGKIINIPRYMIPKNDIKTKFWLSVEPYCGPITKDDIMFLDDITQECNMEIDMKIPSLGPHYTLKWKSEAIKELFKDEHDIKKISVEKILSILKDLNLNDIYKNTDDSSLLSALIEENDTNDGQDKIENFRIFNLSGNSKVCFEKRTRKELEELDILNSIKDELGQEEDDQILEEIKKCQKELIDVNSHNKTELNKLHYLIDKSLIRQEFNEKLHQVDNQVRDIYNKLSTATEEKTELEWEAINIIQLQRKLHKKIMDMIDVEIND